MSTAAPATRVKVPTWKITKTQWGLAVLVFLGILLVFITYEAFNFGPGPDRWPGYYAWDPQTGQLAQPLSGSGAYQTFILKSWLDKDIPFVPLLAIPYISFLVIAPILVPLLNLGVSSFRRFLTVGFALIVSQLVLDIGYWLFQTNVVRDVTVPSGFSGFLVETVWGKDEPFNGYPSGHCTWATIVICSLFRLRKVMPKTAWILMGWLCLVYPATVMLRQHYLMDVYAGIFIGFACYWACMFVIERPRLVPRAEPPLGAAREPGDLR